MEKRTILAILLSVLVLIAFGYFEQRRQRPLPAKLPDVETRGGIREPSTPAAPSLQAEAAPQAEAPPAPADDTNEKGRTIIVEGELYRAVIDNRGAVLNSWQLKKYKSSQGTIFEMVAASHDGETRSFPGSMIFSDSALTSLANNEFYQVLINDEPDMGIALAPPVAVTMMLRRGDLLIEKRYRFEKDKYLIELSADFNKGGKPLDGRFLLGQDIGPEQEHLLSPTKLEAIYFGAGKVKREGAPGDEKELKKIEGDVRWAGLDMHYFSIIAIPLHPLPYFDIQKRSVKAVGLDGKPVDRDLIRLTTPVNGSLRYQIYLGPKKQSDLQAVKAADITGVINYGMFSILVLPLLAALRWIHQYVYNYGYAIIILTFLLSLLLFPFRLKQIVSMKKMQAVQPKVKAIQEKYRRYKKTDPKRAEMNKEIMALYKEHKVNPLGGCLPLILQFPLLFAFYSLLANSIELRQAPFVGWLEDLSVKDPYYVLPIVMGITMFISQKMTPMAPGTDPTQAKIMLMMPVVLTALFLNVSSGLNLYFLCSNIFQIGFQKIAERWIGDGKSGGSSKSSK